jgi:endonuclease III
MTSVHARKLRVRLVVHALEKRYGSPRLNNKDDPLDELIFILLSQMTTGPSYERVFDRLKTTLGAWDCILSVSAAKLRALIADAGLSNQKAPRLIAIAKRLREDFGAVTLLPLANLDDEQAERYLTSLPGVGLKTAKCVMMYSLSRQVLPVDTHVQRVASRLGLVSRGIPRQLVHDVLEAVVPPALRYSFHVNAVAHGRELCRARGPLCASCRVHRSCRSSLVKKAN